MPKKFPTITILSISLALFLWFLAVLEKEHNLKIKMKIRIDNLPPDLFILKQTPKEIFCEISGKGRDFLNNQKYLKEYKLNFDQIFKLPIERFPYRFRLYIDLEKNKNIKDLKLISYSPNYLEIEIDKIAEKEIKIKPILKEERDDYFLLKTSEAEIKVRGPKSELDFLKEILTESLNLKKLKITFDSTKNQYYSEANLSLINPNKEFFQLEKEEVKMRFYFVKIKEREFKNVLVKVISNQKVKLNPQSCQIIVSGPENVLETLQTKNIKAIIDATHLKKGKYQLPAEFLLPKQLYLKKCLPQKFELEIF